MQRTAFALGAATALLLTLSPALSAQPSAGSEFRVNTDGSSRQIAPVSAFSANGDFVVAWENQINGLTVRRYSAAGNALGSDQVVVANDPVPVPFSGRAFARREAALDFAANGQYYLLWTEEEAYLRVHFFIEHRDVRDTNIYGQRFGANGQTIGQPFRVNKIAQGIQERPAVATLPGGGLAAVWQTEDDGVYLRILNPSGRGDGDDVRVDKGFEGTAVRPALAVDSAGNILVAFESCCDADGDQGIFARLYDSNGNAQGDAFAVNSVTLYNQQAPAVASTGEGSFAVIWQSALDDHREEFRIFGQLVKDGALDGAEFQVSESPGRADSAPVLAASGNTLNAAWLVWVGDFRVAVYGRQFGAAGNPLGGAFAINERQIGGQFEIGISAGPGGTFLATWIGKDPFGDLGVAARLVGIGGTGETGDLVTCTGEGGLRRMRGGEITAPCTP